MKKSTSEESTVSQKRKPVRRIETETIDRYGNKTVIEETFFDDGTSSKTTKLPDGPEIVTDTYLPRTSHSAQINQPSSLKDAEQIKKAASAKPEIVTDTYLPRTSHSAQINHYSFSGHVNGSR